MVTVISGANEANANLSGQSVATARQTFGAGLNIPTGARATVNGRAVEDNFVLSEGDRIIFAAATAEKG